MLRIDAYNVLSYSAIAVGLGVVWLFIAWVGTPAEALPILVSMPMMLALMSFQLGTAGLAYDTLPLRRATVMISHYLIALALIVAFAIIGSGLSLLIARLRGLPVDGAMASLTGIILAGVVFALALLLPLALRFGTQVGMLVFVGIWFGALFGVRGLMGLAPDLARAVVEAAANVAPWMIIVAALLAYAASLLISIRIYGAQDH